MSPKALFGPWLYTGTIVVAVLVIVLVNPGDALGESQTSACLGFCFPTYQGQSALLQFLGTFIVAISVMPSLFNSSIPRFVPITATVGSAVVMTGQVIQGIDEISLVPAFLAVIVVYVVPVWILVAGRGWIRRAWALLKSRIKSGDCTEQL